MHCGFSGLGLVHEADSWPGVSTPAEQPQREVRQANGWPCPPGPRVGPGEAHQHLRALVGVHTEAPKGTLWGVCRQTHEPKAGLLRSHQEVMIGPTRARWVLFVESWGRKAPRSVEYL